MLDSPLKRDLGLSASFLNMLDLDFIAGLASGLCIGLSYFALKRYVFAASKEETFTNNTTSKTSVIGPKFTSRSEYKMVLVVRNDLNMTKGKIMSQCCHAAVGAFEEAEKTDPRSIKIWQSTGQAKVAVKSNSLDEVNKIAEDAAKLGIVTFKVVDDGKTQVDPDTLTCLGVGPAPKDVIDKITGHLKLL